MIGLLKLINNSVLGTPLEFKKIGTEGKIFNDKCTLALVWKNVFSNTLENSGLYLIFCQGRIPLTKEMPNIISEGRKIFEKEFKFDTIYPGNMIWRDKNSGSIYNNDKLAERIIEIFYEQYRRFMNQKPEIKSPWDNSLL